MCVISQKRVFQTFCFQLLPNAAEMLCISPILKKVSKRRYPAIKNGDCFCLGAVSIQRSQGRRDDNVI